MYKYVVEILETVRKSKMYLYAKAALITNCIISFFAWYVFEVYSGGAGIPIKYYLSFPVIVLPIQIATIALLVVIIVIGEYIYNFFKRNK